MRAVIYDPASEPHGMRVVNDYPEPKPAPDSLLIKVKAAAINPVDYKYPGIPLLGWLARGRPVGFDFAGEVVSVGAKCEGFEVGERVMGVGTRGTLCEYLLADPSKVAKLPPSMSYVSAAALPLVALTSYQALTKYGLATRDRVLVIGASGGTGQLGVQLAKALGAGHVTAVCSGKNAEFVRELGADEVVDYTKYGSDIMQGVAGGEPFDYVYDCVTSPDDTNYTVQMHRVLKKEGKKYVAINGSKVEWTRALLGAQWGKYALLQYSDADAANELKRVMQWVVEGKVQPIVDLELPLTAEAVREGFDRLKSRRARGKIVFTL